MPSIGSKKPPLAFFKKSPGFGWILDITLLGGRWEAAGTLQRGLGRTGEGENEKKSKNFDGLVEANPMIPHNSGFGWIL